MSKHIDLLIGWPLVVGATVIGCLYTQKDPESWAQVLILGVTAAVVVWYAHQARRTADETRSLAEATQDMVDINRALMEYREQPNLLLDYSFSPAVGRQTFVVNQGQGPARDIKVRTTDSAGGVQEIPVADLVPGAPGPNILATLHPTRDPSLVVLEYNDDAGKDYDGCWKFEGNNRWVAIRIIDYLAISATNSGRLL